MGKWVIWLGALLSVCCSVMADVAWTENYDDGLKQAAAKKKKVLLLFTGSDWCPACRRLEDNLLSSKEFQDYAAGNLIPVKIDFPRQKKQLPIQRQLNEELAQKFGVEGFPTMILLNDQGFIVNTLDYTGQSPAEFVAQLAETPAIAPHLPCSKGEALAAAIRFPAPEKAKTQEDYFRLKYQWMKKKLVDAPLAAGEITPEMASWIDQGLQRFCNFVLDEDYDHWLATGKKIYEKDGAASPYFMPLYLWARSFPDNDSYEAARQETGRVLVNHRQAPLMLSIIYAQRTGKSVFSLLRRAIVRGEFDDAPPQMVYRYFDDHSKDNIKDYTEALPLLRQSKIDPWVAKMVLANLEMRLAWQERGGGYANTVTEKGWRGFREHKAIAEKNYLAAIELHPDWPEAFSGMVELSYCNCKKGEMVEYFNRGLAAQIDFRPLFANLFWGLRPRWLGSHEEMMAVGRRCAQLDARLYHTAVPLALIWAVQDVAGELPYLPRREMLQQMQPEVVAMLERKVAANQRRHEDNAANHGLAILGKYQYLCGDYEAAAKTLSQVWGNDNGYDYMCRFNPFFAAGKNQVLRQLNLSNGPYAEATRRAEALLRQEKTTAAAEEYVRWIPQTKDATAIAFLEDRAVELFLADRARPQTKYDRGIFLLARYSCIPGVKAFLDAGYDVDVRGRDDCTLLLRSLYANNEHDDDQDYAAAKIAMLKFLLSRGADIHALAGPKWTALHLAISNRLPSAVAEFILKSGVDVNSGDCDGETSLMWCAMLNMPDHAEFLLAHGADLNRKDKSGFTALDHAKKEDVRNVLLKHGAKAGIASR
ncbi:MAG: thioredoxin family protein [Victivallales bacterium]|nr:thioredoxin family protein [Victivallales bacterium]